MNKQELDSFKKKIHNSKFRPHDFEPYYIEQKQKEQEKEVEEAVQELFGDEL